MEPALSLKGRGEPGYAVERAFRDCRVNLIIEGTSQIMRLFIAREALDPHLKRVMSILNPRIPIFKRIKSAFSVGLYYMFWYPGLWLPSLALKGERDLPPQLRKHLKFIRCQSKHLARELFLKMMIYQQRLESKQNLLARFVDIGTDLFVMASTCSYAAGLINKKDNPYAKSPLELADLFCREAKVRIKSNFKELNKNNDKIYSAIGKKMLNGQYEWLENEIVK